ncbi:MAG: hypothetical protein ACRC1T_05535 [Clostridium chrysemydis]|uniref:hypothetical protein n=1 Tax=Clostridium chrysemydis TaxID=2665504 RepID=UPI003F406A0A
MSNDLLKINGRIINKYRKFVKDTGNKGILDIRKCLTRNFILGQEKWTVRGIQLRMYGNLVLIVDLNNYRIIDIYNTTHPKHMYINQLEKEKLNKSLNIA